MSGSVNNNNTSAPAARQKKSNEGYRAISLESTAQIGCSSVRVPIRTGQKKKKERGSLRPPVERSSSGKYSDHEASAHERGGYNGSDGNHKHTDKVPCRCFCFVHRAKYAVRPRPLSSRSLSPFLGQSSCIMGDSEGAVKAEHKTEISRTHPYSGAVGVSEGEQKPPQQQQRKKRGGEATSKHASSRRYENETTKQNKTSKTEQQNADKNKQKRRAARWR